MAIESVKAFFASYGIADRVREFEVSSATVELAAQCLAELCLRQFGDSWYFCAEFTMQELAHLVEFGTTDIALVQPTQVGEGLALEGDEHAGDDLLPQGGGWLQAVGYHVVDVLNEDDIGIQFGEVLDECSMATGTEE